LISSFGVIALTNSQTDRQTDWQSDRPSIDCRCRWHARNTVSIVLLYYNRTIFNCLRNFIRVFHWQILPFQLIRWLRSSVKTWFNIKLERHSVQHIPRLRPLMLQNCYC